MIKKTLLYFVVAVLLAAAAATAYYYLVVQRVPASALQSPYTSEAKPDNTVAGGPIMAITGASITILKQNNTTASFSITADTAVMLAGDAGQPGVTQKSADLRVGMMVLVTPSRTSPTQAQTVLIIPPPAQ